MSNGKTCSQSKLFNAAFLKFKRNHLTLTPPNKTVAQNLRTMNWNSFKIDDMLLIVQWEVRVFSRLCLSLC